MVSVLEKPSKESMPRWAEEEMCWRRYARERSLLQALEDLQVSRAAGKEYEEFLTSSENPPLDVAACHISNRWSGTFSVRLVELQTHGRRRQLNRMKKSSGKEKLTPREHKILLLAAGVPDPDGVCRVQRAAMRRMVDVSSMATKKLTRSECRALRELKRRQRNVEAASQQAAEANIGKGPVTRAAKARARESAANVRDLMDGVFHCWGDANCGVAIFLAV